MTDQSMTDLYWDQMTNDRPVLWPTVIATDQSGPSIMTDFNFKICQCFRSISWTCVKIQGGGRMTILIWRGWRRDGWSPWGVLAAWILHKAATGEMMLRLEQEAGVLDWGFSGKNITPGFFHFQHLIMYLNLISSPFSMFHHVLIVYCSQYWHL